MIEPMILPIHLDIETSNSDPTSGEILSLGMYVCHAGVVDYFYCTFRFDRLVVDPAAMRVNMLDVMTLDRHEHSTYEQGQAKARAWVKRMESKAEPAPFTPLKAKAVGKNVGSFDLAFIKVKMPDLFKVFSYQVIDLNTLVAIYALKANLHFVEAKAQAYEAAVGEMRHEDLPNSPGFQLHHALYDCILDHHALKFLEGKL